MSVETEYYVYQMIDPRNSKPFYIGKGKGFRKDDVFRYANPSMGKATKSVVDSIRKSNLSVIVTVIRDGLTESEALILETECIQKFGRRNKDSNGLLTNIKLFDAPAKKTKLQKSNNAFLCIERKLKESIQRHCEEKGLLIGSYIEQLVLADFGGGR